MYDTVWYDKERYDTEVKFIARMVGRTPSSILDLGCGTGNHMHAWKHIWPESNIVGADISADQLSKARKTSNVTIYTWKLSGCNGFERERFDMIACMYDAGQYTSDVDTLLRNTHTWLKPGVFMYSMV